MKSIFKSKTLIFNVLAAAAMLYPPVGSFVATHGQLVGLGLIAVNTALRLVTHQKLSLYGSE